MKEMIRKIFWIIVIITFGCSSNEIEGDWRVHTEIVFDNEFHHIEYWTFKNDRVIFWGDSIGDTSAIFPYYLVNENLVIDRKGSYEQFYRDSLITKEAVDKGAFFKFIKKGDNYVREEESFRFTLEKVE